MNQSFFTHLRSFILITLFLSMTGCNNTQNSSLSTQATATATAIPSSTSTIEPSSTPNPTATPKDTKPVWEIMENWTPANQIRAMLIDQSGDLWTGGPAGVVHWDLKTNTPTVYAIKGDPENTNVLGLSQTPDGSIWVGTYGNGLTRFKGNGWQAFTKKDGLPGDFITAQTVTSRGELWLVILGRRQTIDSAHFGLLSDTNWVEENGGAFDRLVTLSDDSIVSTYNYPYHGGSSNHSTIAMYDGQRWNDMGIYPNGWIDAVTVAPDGVIWFATDDTVYHYENQIWKENIPPWVGKDFTSVSSLAVSKDNTAWFGFSFRTGFDLDQCGYRTDYPAESGVYRYDGKWWMHFTTENGLVDNKICAITIDSNDNVWFGSYDKGVSRFNGKTWTLYVIP